jgi:hypothetical protein
MARKSSKGAHAGALQPWDLPFATLGALYFLDGGHYLWREQDGISFKSKFVTAADVRAAFTQYEEDSGWMPAGVVRCGHLEKGGWFVYSAPEQKRKVILAGSGEDEIEIPLPRTALMGIGKMFYLWALDGERFDPEMEVYQVPFPNIHPDGGICWGVGNDPGEATAQRARAIWELFFALPFNADLANGKCMSERQDVRILLRSLAGKRKFPVQELFSTGNGIGQTVEKILSNVRTLKR